MQRRSFRSKADHQRLRERQGDVPDELRWNHSIHYHPIVLSTVPPGARRGLDVGCGQGTLTRALAARVEHVVGLDPHLPSVTEAATTTGGPRNISYVQGDLLSHPFRPASFDVIVCSMALHHMDTADGLRRIDELLAPGGVIGIIGVGRLDWPRELPRGALGFVVTRVHRWRKGEWEQGAPIVWPPPESEREVRRVASELLPGSVLRSHLLWRYTLTWTKPA